MAISAADVKKLRDMTGAGMMDCKKALTESDGDFDQAIELLRKKGQKVSEKRADRQANQGLIVKKISEDHGKAALLEINCETDFVARNDDFIQKVEKFVTLAFENEIGETNELLDLELDGLKVSEHLKQMVGKIGEKIEINNVIYVDSEGSIVSYIHPGNQLGVLVEFSDEVDEEGVGKDVAMQIAAMNPVALNRDGVDASIVEKELEIAKDQLINEGKPEHIAEKAAQGKLRRFYEENVLLEQKFVKDSGISVKEYLNKEGAPDVLAFYRLQLGEDK